MAARYWKVNKARRRWTTLPGATRGFENQHLGPEGQTSCELFLGMPWGC